MPSCIHACALAVLATTTLLGCANPLDGPTQSKHARALPNGASVRASIYRPSAAQPNAPDSPIQLGESPESFVQYALFNSPDVERAYQLWRAASERIPQASALPDPRLNVGFFLNEVETRVGPQQAKIGLQQTLPWITKLRAREDAAAKGALDAWFQYQSAQLEVTEQVLIALHDLDYLTNATQIFTDNSILLQSIEDVARARYRTATGTHTELIRVQVEKAQLDDRLLQLDTQRRSTLAALNALLNRQPDAPLPAAVNLQSLVADANADEMVQLALQWNPTLQAMDQRIEQARAQSTVARIEGYPELTVGIDYIITDQAVSPSLPESGDDPVMLSFAMNLPIWHEKNSARVRESIARRLSVSFERDTVSNALFAKIYQTHFAHTEADRRVQLYEDSLIPRTQESISAMLAGFQTGRVEFLDLLDAQRSLLEFSIQALQARAARAKTLAALNRLVGYPITTKELP